MVHPLRDQNESFFPVGEAMEPAKTTDPSPR
jgi:hypothetical protein